MNITKDLNSDIGRDIIPKIIQSLKELENETTKGDRIKEIVETLNPVVELGYILGFRNQTIKTNPLKQEKTQQDYNKFLLLVEKGRKMLATNPNTPISVLKGLPEDYWPDIKRNPSYQAIFARDPSKARRALKDIDFFDEIEKHESLLQHKSKFH